MGETTQSIQSATVLMSSRRRLGSESVFEEVLGRFTEGGRFRPSALRSVNAGQRGPCLAVEFKAMGTDCR